MAECDPNAIRRVPLEFNAGTPVRHTKKAQLDLVLHVGILVPLILLLAACGSLPIRNTSPEPQARIELKLFRDYQSIGDKPWSISLTYTPQILIDEVSAEYEEITKGSTYVFTYQSLELRPKSIFIELPNDKVQRVDEDTFYFSIPRETLAGEPGSYILSDIRISKGEELLRARVIPLTNHKGTYPPVPCVYGTPQIPPPADSPVLRARYVGGILSFQKPYYYPSFTFVDPIVNPLVKADCLAN